MAIVNDLESRCLLKFTYQVNSHLSQLEFRTLQAVPTFMSDLDVVHTWMPQPSMSPLRTP